MPKYEKALFLEISADDLIKCANEECTVVCTYMYGYCSESDGWGTTYCPEWGSSSGNDDDD